MIRVTIELIPFGFERHEQRKEIGRIEIFNDGTGDKNTGNYGVRLFRKNSKSSVLGVGSVLGYKRKTQSVWKLVYQAIQSVLR
jgi:hypothetical protein